MKRPQGDVFSGYLVIFPATLSPFRRSGSQLCLSNKRSVDKSTDEAYNATAVGE